MGLDSLRSNLTRVSLSLGSSSKSKIIIGMKQSTKRRFHFLEIVLWESHPLNKTGQVGHSQSYFLNL